jgi:hypothetical protein
VHYKSGNAEAVSSVQILKHVDLWLANAQVSMGACERDVGFLAIQAAL